MSIYQKIFASITFCLLLSPIISAQSGGAFEITQSVISNGGGNSTGGSFDLNGTAAQALAGTNSTGGAFGVRGGFWQGFFAPTATMAVVSGRVSHSNGKGIFRARVTMTDFSGVSRIAATDWFGKYRFDDVAAGQFYIFSVSHRQYQFINNTQALTILEDTENVNFTAEP